VNPEIKKRIFTSILLLSLLTLMFLYNYILISSLIIITVLSWIEFYALIAKIFKKENNNNMILRFIYKSMSLLYLSILIYFIIIIKSTNTEMVPVLIFSIVIAIVSDVGGLVVGKIFKGKKLTKISPKKTISGALGSIIFSLLLIPFFNNFFQDYKISILILITLTISLSAQIGDLFISFLKRKAKVKDTSNLLPGHGGVLDRIDGIIFALPVGLLIFSI
jgi:phosphatidate cytidylyltransferase